MSTIFSATFCSPLLISSALHISQTMPSLRMSLYSKGEQAKRPAPLDHLAVYLEIAKFPSLVSVKELFVVLVILIV